MKKPYEKPAIVHTEILEVRAITCMKGSDADGVCASAIVT